MIRAIVRLLFGCAHGDRISERRELHGVMVPCYVCIECGHAIPKIARTPAEAQRVSVEGAITPYQITRSKRTKAKRRPDAQKLRAVK